MQRTHVKCLKKKTEFSVKINIISENKFQIVLWKFSRLQERQSLKMGRKIPGKKHRRNTDAEKQIEKREAELRLKVRITHI